jgi:hypothetical protein
MIFLQRYDKLVKITLKVFGVINALSGLPKTTEDRPLFLLRSNLKFSFDLSSAKPITHTIRVIFRPGFKLSDVD